MTASKKPRPLTRSQLEYENKTLQALVDTLVKQRDENRTRLNSLEAEVAANLAVDTKLRAEETKDKDFIRDQLILAWLAIVDMRFLVQGPNQDVLAPKLQAAREHIEKSLERSLLRPKMSFWMTSALVGIGGVILSMAYATGLWVRKSDAPTKASAP